MRRSATRVDRLGEPAPSVAKPARIPQRCSYCAAGTRSHAELPCGRRYEGQEDCEGCPAR